MTSPSELTLNSLLDRRLPETAVRETDGELYYYFLQSWDRFKNYEGRIELPASATHLFFGLGSQERADRLLEFGTGHRLYEPDPFRLHYFLTRHEEQVRDQEWKLACGLHFEAGFFGTEFTPAVLPLYRDQYGPLPDNFVRWSQQDSPDPRLLFVQPAALFYRDFLSVLETDRERLFPFNTMNWEPTALLQQFSDFEGSDFFSINLIEGLPAVVARAGLNYTCWEIDPATSPVTEIRSEHADRTSVYTYRRRNIDAYQRAGYENVEYLPLAANPDKRVSLPAEEIEKHRRADVSFVGSSLKKNADRLLNLLMRWINRNKNNYPEAEWSTLRRKMNNWVSEFPEWDESTLTRLQNQLAQLNIPLRIEIENEEYRLPMMLAEYRAFRKRLDVVRTTGDEFPLAVWGDAGWQGQTGRRGKFHGEAAHGRELTEIYNGSKINLDINRIYQPEIVTMRVFDVMACGGVVLTEKSEALLKLFNPGEECLVYEDRADLVDKLNYYLENEVERREIGRRAREKIIADHTISQRLERIGLVGGTDPAG